jgi:hypothetical protein
MGAQGKHVRLLWNYRRQIGDTMSPTPLAMSLNRDVVVLTSYEPWEKFIRTTLRPATWVSLEQWQRSHQHTFS